jgi:hypothetical protein
MPRSLRGRSGVPTYSQQGGSGRTRARQLGSCASSAAKCHVFKNVLLFLTDRRFTTIVPPRSVRSHVSSQLEYAQYRQ